MSTVAEEEAKKSSAATEEVVADASSKAETTLHEDKREEEKETNNTNDKTDNGNNKTTDETLTDTTNTATIASEEVETPKATNNDTVGEEKEAPKTTDSANAVETSEATPPSDSNKKNKQKDDNGEKTATTVVAETTTGGHSKKILERWSKSSSTTSTAATTTTSCTTKPTVVPNYAAPPNPLVVENNTNNTTSPAQPPAAAAAQQQQQQYASLPTQSPAAVTIPLLPYNGYPQTTTTAAAAAAAAAVAYPQQFAVQQPTTSPVPILPRGEGAESQQHVPILPRGAEQGTAAAAAAAATTTTPEEAAAAAAAAATSSQPTASPMPGWAPTQPPAAAAAAAVAAPLLIAPRQQQTTILPKQPIPIAPRGGSEHVAMQQQQHNGLQPIAPAGDGSQQPPHLVPAAPPYASYMAAAAANPAMAAGGARPQNYYAVRKGRNGLSGCLFMSWDHARQHVENYDDADYQCFANIFSAIDWLSVPVWQLPAEGGGRKRDNSDSTGGENNPNKRQRIRDKEREMAERKVKLAKQTKSWAKQYEELMKHKAQHGSCDVPRNEDGKLVNERLSRFVANQRTHYKRFVTSLPSDLNEDKISLLKDLDFDFGYYTFDERLEQLKKYREECGDDKAVPLLTHSRLGKFTKKAFEDIKHNQNGKPLKHFKKDEIERLVNEVGFELSNQTNHSNNQNGGGGGGSGEATSTDDAAAASASSSDEKKLTRVWQENYTALVQFREKHGTSYIHRGEDGKPIDAKLAAFVSVQKCQYRKFKENKSSFMTKEKVELLKKINFDFGYYSFDERLEQLRQYREVCGDLTAVPPLTHPQLGKWTKQALEDLDNMKNDKPFKHFTQENINRLVYMGFDEKNCQKEPTTEEDDKQWDIMFEELRQHKEATGTFICQEKTELSKWIKRQRQEYAKIDEGKPSVLNPQQIKRLLSLGFNLNPHSRHVKWADRMKQLAAYRAKHGHLNITRKDPQLGRFVCFQRNEYRRYLEGEPGSTMNEERIRQLTELGFVFQAGKRRGTGEFAPKPWEERFQQLLKFQELHGHVMVPQMYNDIPGLGSWVHQQRREYKKMVDGKKTQMNGNKMRKLTDVGFVFKT